MATTYSLLSFDSEEDRLKNPSPPFRNLVSAARFVTGLLTENGVRNAFMGGFAMVLRGSSRTTSDVDIVTEATMRQLWKIIETQDRLIIPESRQLDGVIRMFVKTGPGQDHCIASANIEVDLVTGGAKGTPRDLLTNSEALPALTIDGETLQFQGLNLFYMVKIKLSTYSNRAMPRDFLDICHLIRTYPEAVQGMLGELNHDDIDIFLAHEGFDVEEKELLCKILGGT